MKNVCGEEKSPSLYEKNDTMIMLGRQCAAGPFWCNEWVRECIKEIMEVRPLEFTIESASDIFMLGFMEGKRAERARRKKTA